LKIDQHESHLKPGGTLSVTIWAFSITLDKDTVSKYKILNHEYI
jgi:hypothetical protein